MATYIEIRKLFNDGTLKNRVSIAVIIAANDILAETPPGDANRKAWASKAFQNPNNEAVRILMAVLAANSGATVAQIQNVTDAQIQTNVDAAINLFIDADAGV